MATTLVIAEKPDAAEHIANALHPKGKPRRIRKNGVPFFEVKNESDRVLVGSALGHLYEVDSKDDSSRKSYPVWDYAWKPKHLVERGLRRQERWLNAISEIAKEADSYVNACDFDVEGSLIGLTILRFACSGADKIAKRMKFSTLTMKELVASYENLLPELDFALAYAGMCRHEIDWLYGVNLSRALTQSAYQVSKRYSTLSTGRVQGPTLRFVVEREREIETYVPKPFWNIRAVIDFDGEKLEAEFEKEKIDRKAEAEEVISKCSQREGIVSDIESRTYRLSSPTPFDVSSMQAEAYGHFGYSPRATVAIAERLYLDALISYPRTSSQKLPESIGYKQILQSLAQIPDYEVPSKLLLGRSHLRPNEGRKDDPAHPAVYPTGLRPERSMGLRDQRVYDLIVRRFLATFGSTATKQSDRATITVGDYHFYLHGSRIIEKGWISLYEPYAKFEDIHLPPMQKGQLVKFLEVILDAKFTQPAARFNPSSLLKAMEDAGIGTKATRAEIIETLYRRGYVKGERLTATPLAFRVIDILDAYCPKVIDVKLTHELEEMMEKIELGKETRETVVLHAVEHLRAVMLQLRSREAWIGKELAKTIRAMRMNAITFTVPCPSCRGTLLVLRSKRTGKRFIGCSGKWKTNCSFALPLPQFGALTLLQKQCQDCGFQLVQVRMKGRRSMISCSRCFAGKAKAVEPRVAPVARSGQPQSG